MGNWVSGWNVVESGWVTGKEDSFSTVKEGITQWVTVHSEVDVPVNFALYTVPYLWNARQPETLGEILYTIRGKNPLPGRKPIFEPNSL